MSRGLYQHACPPQECLIGQAANNERVDRVAIAFIAHLDQLTNLTMSLLRAMASC